LYPNRYVLVTSVFRSPSRLVCSYQREAIVKLIALAGLFVLAGVLGVILTSRGSDHASSTQTGRYPYTNPIKRHGSSAARLTGDGRYFGYVRAVDATSEPPTLSFDVARFFFGKNVQKAAEKYGAVTPGEAVSNDHYERNSDAQAQTLPVEKDARVTAAGVTRILTPQEMETRCRSGCGWVIPASLDEFFRAVETEHYDVTTEEAPIPVWLTIRDGLVVRIDEQYFP